MPIKNDADVVRALLNGHWSPYVPYAPSAKQLAFCALPHMEALGGGAAGGGKSAVLLMDALRYTDVPGYAAIIFRRSLTDLKRNGGLLDMAMQWLGPYIGRDLIYEPSTHMFKWFNGASLTFGYVGSYTAWEHYQGGNYQYIAWDELTQHSEQDYDEMFSRLRRNSCAIHGDFPQKGCPNCDLYAQLRSVPLRVRGACVDEGEVLTGSGWKDIRLVKKGELVYSTNVDGKLELKQVEDVYKSFYDGPLTRIRKKNLYMSMTPDHKVLEVTRGQKKQYKLIPFDEHRGTSIKVARTPLDYDGTGCGLSSNELAFLGLYLAEGSFSKPRKGNYKVIITQCNQHKVAPIKKLLTDLGYNWCYSKNGDFQVTKKALWEKFSVFGKAHEKFVPREVLQRATKEELRILFDWMVFGDGHVRKNCITYVTCSGQLADDVMEIGLKLGYKVQYDHHTMPNDKHRDRYTVYLTKSNHPATLVDRGSTRNDVRNEHYLGNVYCLKVKDNANFVLRQRGKVWLSGNTNPGGRGHLWVKKRFKLYKSKSDSLINPVTKKPGIWVSGDESKPFIPWFFVDNPGLDQETYDQTLRMIRDDQRKAQLLEGDWDWIANGVFRPEWFATRWEYMGGYYAVLSPSTGIKTHSYHENDLRIFITVDVACSVREGVGERSFKQTQGGIMPASWTVMGVFAVTPKQELLVLDVVRFQQEAPGIFDALRDICRKWKPMYVALEVNGPGKPIAQQALQYGIPLKEVISFVDKPSNSVEAQIRARQGKVILPREDSTTWQNDFLGELTTWTGHPHETDDQVDVLSNAVHEFTRLCGNPDRDTTLKSHARDLPFVSKKHGKIFDYPSATDLMPW